MAMLQATDYIACSAAVADAVRQLRGAALGAELGCIAARLLGGQHGAFVQVERADADDAASAQDGQHWLRVECASDGKLFGRFDVARPSAFDEHEHQALSGLAALAASFMQLQSLALRSTHAYAQIENQLARQSQILDQINESVVTLDRQAYITSWNKGAERLFGYTELEAVGRNILFLYAEEEPGFPDPFLAQGGDLMEVRRRKKSGEVFWASMSLAKLHGPDGKPSGLIAYLTDITERKLAEERLHHLAYYDALTGLPNRTLLAKLVDQTLTLARRKDAAGCVLFIDLNRFKPINDTLGRAIGDALLRQVAQRFRAALREQDVVARLSSDEFAVALFDVREHLEASTVAAKLQACLVEPFMIEGHDLRIGASIGISAYPQDGHDAESLLRLADIAMERAKQGRDSDDRSVAFFSSEMNQGMQDRMRIESGLRQALHNGELLLHYQPKFDIGNDRVVGAEALVRWQHPLQGLVPPGQFIPVAEATGLIVPLGEWVLEAACIQAAQWQAAGFAPFRVAVNVSAREFTSTLPERVKLLLQRHALDPAWLELEITESTLMNNIERVIAIMDQITVQGVTLSLDDFGTGYSSLSYLKRFPIDTLKIDRSFTMGIPDDANDCAIASTIISIARQLKHRVIAEGVETEEQLAFLRRAGCDEVQGFLYSKPLTAAAFEAALRERWL